MKRNISTLFILCLSGLIMAQSAQDQCTDQSAYLGIHTQQVTGAKATALSLPVDGGAMITKVMTGGAADRADLRAFDYIYAIDDQELDHKNDLADLLSQYQAGDQVDIHVVRQGTPITINLILGHRSDVIERKLTAVESPFLGITNRGSENDRIGVLIGVVSGSAAEAMGLLEGDRINAINGYTIVDWSDITTAISMLEVGAPVTVEFERDGRTRKVSGSMKSRAGATAQNQSEISQEYAFLGIYSNTISRAKAKKLGFENAYGSYVSSVIGNTAAERAGIQPFDYIYGIDEYRTAEGQSLTHILRRYRVGERATVHYVRLGRDRQVQVNFGSRAEARRAETDRCQEPFLGVQASHTYAERTGVSVAIIRNSTAQTLGMEDKDLITSINGYPIIDWDDISTAVDNMEVGSTITVRWQRQGREMSGSAPIMSYCQTKTNQLVPDRIPRSAPPDTDPKPWPSEIIIADISAEEAREMNRSYGLSLRAENAIGMRSMKVAARPERGVFELSFELPRRGPTTVRIINERGREIYIYDLGTFTGSFSDEIDLSQNGAGTYYLSVEQSGSIASKRLVIRKG